MPIILFVVVIQLPSHVRLFVTLWTAAHQASLSFTISRSLPKFMSTESVMSSNHLIPCRPLLLLPSILPSVRVFSNESALQISYTSTEKEATSCQSWETELSSTNVKTHLNPGLFDFFTWKFYFPELCLFPLVCYFFLTHASRLSKKASKMRVFLNLHFWLFFAYIISFVLITNDLFTSSNDPTDILN